MCKLSKQQILSRWITAATDVPYRYVYITLSITLYCCMIHANYRSMFTAQASTVPQGKCSAIIARWTQVYVTKVCFALTLYMCVDYTSVYCLCANISYVCCVLSQHPPICPPYLILPRTVLLIARTTLASVSSAVLAMAMVLVRV